MTLTTPSQNSSSSSISDKEFKKINIYERIKCIYTRDVDFNLSFVKDFASFELKPILEKLKLNSNTFSVPLEITLNDNLYYIWEKKREGNFCGVITEKFLFEKLDIWFINLIIATSKVYFTNSSNYDTIAPTDPLTYTIMNEFVNSLKKTGKMDEWETKGKFLFEKQLNYFVSRGITIQAVLPAFPCKSSNPSKVVSWEPDKGEELALTKIICFAKKIKDIYFPGIVLNIVSDGHVFSDCIGVDDDVVDRYSLELQKLYSKLKPDDFDPISFYSMKDIFFHGDSINEIGHLLDFEIEHYLNTTIEPISESCRKLLISTCDTDSGKLKDDIRILNHPRLRLFRGFLKFMSEDLLLHPAAKSLSRKKYKKLVSKIAFEMIKRNDAYSNLVEVMFPSYLRFSIHAHTNSGPKFGVNLMDSEECKVIRTLENFDEPSFDNFEDLLHIPTPWHNCVLKLEGSKHYFITVIDVINQAIKSGSHKGTWNNEEKYFLLTRTKI